MNKTKQQTVQWLQLLFFFQLASLVLTLLPRLELVLSLNITGSWLTWVKKILQLGIAVCLFLLPWRYRPSAIAKAAGLLCTLLSLVLYRLITDVDLYLTVRNLLYWGALLLALLAQFLEYRAHGATAPQTGRKWNYLFAGSLAVTLVTSAAAALLQPVMDEMVYNGITWGITLWNLIALLLTLAVNVCYLIFLYQTVQAVKNQDVTAD